MPRPGGIRPPSPSSISPQSHYGNLWNPVSPSGDCYGIWPTIGGQSTYANNCYGHDEPGIQFYSTMPGSGGNVTWNVTLPTSPNATNLQADLYSAIWFGMTLSDPYGWLGQCFLELQFYPDSSWGASGNVWGTWVGAAVAWQIENANGYEDPCFYQVLNDTASTGGGYFTMAQGDKITVSMTGWTGSLYGENLTITDDSNGQQSFVNLYNSALAYPLDPAYVDTSFPNGLQWTPGGELPVVFAFETGHTTAPFPNNNSYGGCSAGVPPPTATDGAVPCPSYDPGFWVNNTVQPWLIQVPTFWNATARERPSQVSFTQDLGGIAFIDPISGYTCAGRDGSAYCSYPWYSYSCGVKAFEFGATDYPGVSEDFGQYHEYASNYIYDELQLSYVPPTNFSIPTCGGPSSSLTVDSANPSLGSAYFLSQTVTSSQVFSGLGAGEYALAASPTAGSTFTGWTTNGFASVSSPANPSTTVWVKGDGTVSATFSTGSISHANLTFRDYPFGSTGKIAVYPGFSYTTGVPIATVKTGGTLTLAPGIYTVQAYPPAGYNFTKWVVTGGGAYVAAPKFPCTWLVVPTAATGVTVGAWYASSSATNAVSYSVYVGSGSVSFNNGLATTSGYGTVTVGTYSLKAIPSTGWAFEGWYAGSGSVLSDFEASTNVTLESGITSYLYAEFGIAVSVKVSPAGGGAVSFNYGPPLVSQSTVVAAGSYTLVPAPAPGYYLKSWSVSSSTNLWAYPYVYGGEILQVNGTGTVTANFATASASSVTLDVSPAGSGLVTFNYAPATLGTANTSVTDGTYYVTATPAPGYNSSGWNLSSGLSMAATNFLTVSGSGGTATALFTKASYPVTFIDSPPSLTVAVGGTVQFPGKTVPSDVTLWLGLGPTRLLANLVSGYTFVGWATSRNIGVAGGATANVSIGGPGTVELMAAGFIVSASLSPSATIDLGRSISFTTTVSGAGPFSYAWLGLPPGCTPANTAALTCSPSQAGIYAITVTVNDSYGVSVTTAAGTLTVNPALAASGFTASPTNLTVGYTTTIRVGTTGGTTPYAFVYSGLPVGCAGANTPVIHCTPAVQGTSTVTVKITDAASSSLLLSTSITVNPVPLITSFVSTQNLLDVGLTATLTTAFSGGTAPVTIAYTGLPQGCASANLLVLNCTSTAEGNYTVGVTATDADGFVAQSTLHLSINSAPAIASFRVTVPTITLNDSLTFVVAVQGGTAPFSYHYFALPPGCTSKNVSTFVCVPYKSGNYTAGVTVIDVFGANRTAHTNITVLAPPYVPPATTTTPAAFSLSVGWIAIVVVVLAAVAILVGYWAYRRRSRPPSDEAQPSDEETLASDDRPDLEGPT